jgi:hypothetical protein
MQTNDQKLLERVLLEHAFSRTFSERDIRQIIDNVGVCKAWHIKEIALQLAQEARASERERVKPLEKALAKLLEALDRTELLITNTSRAKGDNNVMAKVGILGVAVIGAQKALKDYRALSQPATPEPKEERA